MVVVNNDGGGIFEGLEPARFGGGVSGRRPQAGRSALTVFERTFGTPHGASIEHLAAAFGIPYTLAERPGEIAKAVAATVPGSGPRIVEARTGRAPNADLRARMRAAALAALACRRRDRTSAGHYRARTPWPGALGWDALDRRAAGASRQSPGRLAASAAPMRPAPAAPSPG